MPDAYAFKRESRDAQYNDVFQAIGQVDESPTQRDIERETHRGTRQVRRILTELLEQNRIKRVRDDEDGRVVRYELAVGGIDR